MKQPDYNFETSLQTRGYSHVAGVDEVGRGPLAGPVTAAAVILHPDHIPEGLNDSKKLSAKRREIMAKEIIAHSDWAVAHASVQEIDELNILKAAHLAMERAIYALRKRPDYLLIDGNIIPRGLQLPSSAIVKGDTKSLSISAASVIAKVERDRIMVDLGQQFPGYGWEKNAGYPTKQHREALHELGVTPHHRCSFKPVHNILYQE